MKNKHGKLKALAAVIVLSVISAFSASSVLAAGNYSARDASDCVYLGIEGKYIAEIQKALDRINEIRLEACNEGVQNPSTGTPLTKEDYVPIQWSAHLESIARTRAAEASMTMYHARLNGQDIWSLFEGYGFWSCSEVLAWNWSDSMTHGIDQWYGEKYDWVNNTGGVTGHYTSMIDPSNLYVGLGTFCSELTPYYNTTAGAFTGDYTNPDTSRGKSTGVIIQPVEVSKEYVSYSIEGENPLYVSAAINYNGIVTEGLTLTGETKDNVKWSSSDKSIVTVSKGNLTRVGCGTAKITAVLPDGTSLSKSVAYDHSFETTTVPATCKDEGTIINKCKICGHTETQTIPKTNRHTYETTTIPSTCKDEGTVTNKCKICGHTETQTIPKTNNHSFGEWKTTKPATEHSEGEEQRTCSLCNLKQTRTIKPLSPNQPSQTANISESTSQTSSSSSADITANTPNSSQETSSTANTDSTSTSTHNIVSNTSSSSDKTNSGNSEISDNPPVSTGNQNNQNDTDNNSANPLPIIIMAAAAAASISVVVVIMKIRKK